jgi:hypothetical protein
MLHFNICAGHNDRIILRIIPFDTIEELNYQVS